MSELKLTRRQMLKSGSAAAAVFSIVPRHVLGGPGVTPPSEIITKGIVGVGGMGRGHISGVNPEAKLLAICDVDESHLMAAKKQAGGQVDTYKDFRELIAREDIDIVHIPTPPHWHALISIAAAEAGKDIWCEKPMSRTIYEGQKVTEAVQKYGRVFRLNTWFRFQSGLYGFGTPAKPVKQIVENGLLGWPLKATVNAATGFNWKHNWSGLINQVPQEVPKELDYDMWLGPAPFKPYHPHRVHANFRGYWDYDGGGLGDMGMHYLDPVQYILDKDHTSPVEIIPDTIQQHPDAVMAWKRVELKYADGCVIILDGDNRDVNAPFIEGPEGKLYPGLRSNIPNLQSKLATLPEPKRQITDFLESVRTRKPFALNDMNGHRSCTLVNLAKIAIRLNRPLKFDPVKQRFIDDPGANRLVKQPMRAPWHL